MQVYTGEYEFTLGVMEEGDLEDKEVTIEEMEELLLMLKDLRCSPIARTCCEKVQFAIGQRKSGVPWAELHLGLQFAAINLKTATKSHIKKIAKEVREASP